MRSQDRTFRIKTVALLLAALLVVYIYNMESQWVFVNAARQGNINKVRSDLNKGANPNGVSLIGGITPLRMAISGGHLDVIHLLLQHGADPTDGLHQAIVCNRLDLVQLLITKGANVNAKAGYNKSPLQTAKEYGNKQIVHLLEASGSRE